MRLVLDACVLFPPLVRGIVLSTAEAGLYTPLWSDRILDEWRIAAVRKQGAGTEDAIIAIQARMAETFPGSRIAPGPEDDLHLPDPADTHVLAAAIAGQAPQIVTFNLRDFPRRVLWPYGVEAVHPDSFLWQVFSEDPDGVTPAVLQTLKAQDVEEDRHRAALKRARLPRFAKAWEAAR